MGESQQERDAGRSAPPTTLPRARPAFPPRPRSTCRAAAARLFETGAIYRNTGDVTVWLKGAVFDEYTAVGGAGGRLGLPTSKVVTVTGSPDARRGAAGPRSCADGSTGSRASAPSALWGRVLDTFLAHNGVDGSLGFPTSRVQVADNGSTSATFEHGSIDCPPPDGGELHDQLTLSTCPRTSAPARCSCIRRPS